VQIIGGLIVLIGVILAQTSRAEYRDDQHDNLRKTHEDMAISRPRA
jgi:hypothetical protein